MIIVINEACYLHGGCHKDLRSNTILNLQVSDKTVLDHLYMTVIFEGLCYVHNIRKYAAVMFPITA
jgi:hypothetical protein